MNDVNASKMYYVVTTSKIVAQTVNGKSSSQLTWTMDNLKSGLQEEAPYYGHQLLYRI